MNAKIENARQAALDVLRPTAAELRHGLELHRDALVIDGYGFAAMGAPDPNRLNPLVEDGASSLELQDARENDAMTRWALDENQFREAKEAWEAAGVDCVWINAGEESNTIDTLFKRLARRSYSCHLRRDFCRQAYLPDDIPAAKQAGMHSLYMTANGIPMPHRFQSLPDELSFIQPLFQLGVRMAHLVYQRSNLIGHGCGEARDGGLTDYGRAVVAEMNRVGMIVDVAHAGPRTSLEAARCSDKPMVASHTVCRALHEHIRAKSDEVMRAIAATGGYVGICCIPAFMGRSWDLNAFLDHVEYAKDLLGADHVAIGTDVGHGISPGDRASPPRPSPKRRPQWRSLWPGNPLETPPECDERARLSLAWTNFPMITVGLIKRGFSDEDTANILGGNCLRVAKTLWDEREP